MASCIAGPDPRGLAVETRDPFSRHAEELIRSRYAPEVADRGYEWPQSGVTREDFRDAEVIVSRVGGAVVGRAILDRVYYPLAELENLEVCPPFRGQGAGSALVGHAIETGARAGFVAIHAQTEKGNTAAQRLYAAHGFLPTTRGEMLRVWKFLNLPVLSQFVHDHPMALLHSEPTAEREHSLRWCDTINDDELAITLRGGSCQRDSGGVAPAVSALRLRSGSVRLAAMLGEAPPTQPGGSFALHIVLANEGASHLAGGFRTGLNPGFHLGSDHPGGERFSIAPGAATERSVPVALGSAFPIATLGICAYPSVPVTVDFLLGDHTFWLVTQVPVIRASGG